MKEKQEKIRTLLQGALLLSDGISTADLLIKYGYHYKDVIASGKVLKFIEGLK